MIDRYVIFFYVGRQGYGANAYDINSLTYQLNRIPNNAVDIEIVDQLRRKHACVMHRSDALKLIPKFEAIK